MIKIIKHRVNSIKDANLVFGGECDVWNYRGNLVLSHDSPNDNSLYFDELLDLDLPVYAINAKSTGLEYLYGWLEVKDNYFIFDCAVPEAIKLMNLGLRVYTRHSEYEFEPSFLLEAHGVWMDMMLGDWINERNINEYLTIGKEVAITSPELHGREYKEFWQRLKKMELSGDIYLCTKFPEEAAEFFSSAV